ncbi:LOW QUALITY PROTEIN: hypothetical protein V2J09_001334 [Rumex salicifolius]
MEDPPSLLIGQFLEKQKVVGEMCLDMDLEMEKLRHDTRRTAGLPPLQGCGTMEAERHTIGAFLSYGNNVEVVRCTSSAAFGRVPILSRAKTVRSRMMDPLPASMYDHFQSQEQHQHQHHPHPQARSGQMWSGFLGGGGRTREEAIEEEDPFMEDDLPKYHRKEAISIIPPFDHGALIGSLAVSTLRRTKLWRIMMWKWECWSLSAGGWSLEGSSSLVLLIERNFTLRKRILYFVYGLKKGYEELHLARSCLPHLELALRCQAHRTLHPAPRHLRHQDPDMLPGGLCHLANQDPCHQGTCLALPHQRLLREDPGDIIQPVRDRDLFHRAEEEEERTLAEIQMLQSAGTIVPPELEANVLPLAAPAATVDVRITLDNLHKLDQKNVFAWKMKRLMNIVRRGALTTLDDHLDLAAHLNETSKQIRSEVEAKATAKKIFHNVARPRARFIYSEDLLRFLQKGKVLKTLSMFEKGIESERIRKALALTLTDTKSAIIKLHRMDNILVSVIIGIIWLTILDSATSQFLVFASSQFILIAFVFGNSCKNVFESIIFKFVIHPYDVGNHMVVEEMNIWTTVFLRYNNQKITFPNYIFFMKPIGNYIRSPNIRDAVEFCCHIIRDIEDSDMAATPDEPPRQGERWGRCALLVEECVKIFRELDI